MTRLTFALALLAGGLALAQPDTYFVPIAGRTVPSSPVGANAMGTAIWLPDPGVDASQSLLFGFGDGASTPFVLATQGLANLSNFPAQVDAVATAPGVVVDGQTKTLVAILSNGAVSFATLENDGALYSALPVQSIDAGTQIALSAVTGGGAALLVADGFNMTRFDLDLSGATPVVRQGGSLPASAGGTTDQSNTIIFDGINNVGFIGGRVLGDIYQFDPRMDAGIPTAFDVALVSQGRLAAPVTGFALYSVPGATYLLAANTQGLTVYDLRSITPLTSAFRVIPFDAVGPISAPAGVAQTNLPVGSGAFSSGVIAVGDRAQTDLALLGWGQLASQVDGGLVLDPSFDPRGGDGGVPDGGVPDGGVPDGGGGGNPSGGRGPVGPGIPVDHGSSCATAAGAPVLLLLLAGLGLIPRRRRQRR